MAAQQIQFAETIRAMKLALKRTRNSDESSDSDIDLPNHTNRGHKLKRGARYTSAGRLDNTGGLAYKRKITHAGYTRHIISRKPTLYDEDGDAALSPNHSSDDEPHTNNAHGRARASPHAHLEPIHDDAFSSVHLERLLRPLTKASDLPEHASLSVAYKSQALTQMTEQALEMVRRERAGLWKAKRLLGRFRGDGGWMPCGVFEGEGDEEDLLDGQGFGGEQAAVPEKETGEIEREEQVLPMDDGGEDEGMDGVQTLDMAAQKVLERQEADADNVEQAQEAHEKPQNDGQDIDMNSNGDLTEEPASNFAPAQDDTKQPEDEPPLPTTEDDDPQPDSEQTSNSGKENKKHSMTTRARARSPVQSNSMSPTPSDYGSVPEINPWFLIPTTALPDRDLGLPATEAEESRRLLLLYVQKQEQIVRSLNNLYAGLQRADRLRKSVLHACRAEGHTKDDKGSGRVVTEMSDGEDWYDVEALGLGWSELKMQKDGLLGLEKGKDEAEDIEEEGRRVGGRRRRVARM